MLKADVDVSFSLRNLEDAEQLNPAWIDPQSICNAQGSSVQGKLGPFGLLVLASENLSEQTAVFFRIFVRNGSYIALMCSDLSRPVISNLLADFLHLLVFKSLYCLTIGL